MKIYLKIQYLGYDNIAELQYRFYIFNVQNKFSLKLRIPSSRDNNTDSTTRSQHVQSLVTHDIADKTTYLSKATE